MNEFDELDDELDEELDEEAAGCPFCGDNENSCPHALAGIEVGGGGEFYIGLIGGPLESAASIGAFFEKIACMMIERALLRAGPPPNLPADYDFVQPIVNDLWNHVPNFDHEEKEYDYIDDEFDETQLEEDEDEIDIYDLAIKLVQDCPFQSGAYNCVEKMLDHIGFPVTRQFMFIDGACCSSNCETWYCPDSEMAAGKLDAAFDELWTVIVPYLKIQVPTPPHPGYGSKE